VSLSGTLESRADVQLTDAPPTNAPPKGNAK
jgi:hypothetical protein